jgi:hypothetical protein
MESLQFAEWFKSVLIPHCAKINGNKLLLMDGHASHISLEIVQLARENSIHFLIFPPHATHEIQPLDVAVFGPAKKAWRQIVSEHVNSTGFSNVEKSDFPKLFAEISNRNLGFLRRHIVAGFEATGIFPFNPAAFKPKTQLITTCHEQNQSTQMIEKGHEQNQSTHLVTTCHEQNQSTQMVSKSPLVGTASHLDDIIGLEEDGLSNDSISIYSGELMDYESSSESDENMDTTDSDLEIVKFVKPPQTKCSFEARAESNSSLQSTQQGLSNAIRGFIQNAFVQKPKSNVKRLKVNRPMAQCMTEEQILEEKKKRDEREIQKKIKATERKEKAALKKQQMEEKKKATQEKKKISLAKKQATQAATEKKKKYLFKVFDFNELKFFT